MVIWIVGRLVNHFCSLFWSRISYVILVRWLLFILRFGWTCQQYIGALINLILRLATHFRRRPQALFRSLLMRLFFKLFIWRHNLMRREEIFSLCIIAALAFSHTSRNTWKCTCHRVSSLYLIILYEISANFVRINFLKKLLSFHYWLY